MTEYLARESERSISLLDLAPLLEPWPRSELLDEMRSR